MLMEYEKLGLSLPNEIYLYTLPLSMDGRPSRPFRNFWSYLEVQRCISIGGFFKVEER